ncbi:MAG: class I SAM-dependent methyltransferase [bacterium]
MGATRRDYYQCERNEMLDFISNNTAQILEIGPGEGLFGRVLKEKFNVQLWGIEQDSVSAEKASQYFDTIFCDDFKNVFSELPEQYFDCVIFNDVLEHFEDPWDVLQKVKKILNDKGYIVASIPNVRYWRNLQKLLLQKDWHYCEKGILDRTHLRFFTKKSIMRLFKESGYQVDVIKGINPTSSRNYRIVNTLLFNLLNDCKWLQYAVKARKGQ